MQQVIENEKNCGVRTPIFSKDSGIVNSTIRISLVRLPKEISMFYPRIMTFLDFQRCTIKRIL